MKVAVTTNDPRGRDLFAAVGGQADIVADVEFDDVDPFTRYAAGVLSYRPDRSEWWTMYQMHPLVQRRRSRVLRDRLCEAASLIDGLIVHGSWFHPRLERLRDGLPFVNYIDQSLALEPVLGETRPRYVNRRTAHRLQSETYAASAGVLTYSRWGREQTLLAHPTLTPDKVQAVGWGPCGIDLSDEDLAETDREPVVLHVSNDFHRKGLDFLVETAEVVRRSMPEVRFLVIGEDYGGMKDVPRSEAVTYLGRIHDRQELERHFRRASVFFLPHRFDRSPHVLVEAMSASLPIVTSAQGGPHELTDGTGAGVAVAVGDVQGYVDGIMRFLGDPEEARAAGRAGRRLMRERYSWPAVAGRVLEALSVAS
mgnify:CR=1 FL=1